jgi:hypothetical protein
MPHGQPGVERNGIIVEVILVYFITECLTPQRIVKEFTAAADNQRMIGISVDGFQFVAFGKVKVNPIGYGAQGKTSPKGIGGIVGIGYIIRFHNQVFNLCVNAGKTTYKYKKNCLGDCFHLPCIMHSTTMFFIN